VINRTTIENNTSPIAGYGFIITSYRSVSIEECIIRQNTAGLIIFQKQLSISNSLVEDETIEGYGDMRVTNSSFVNSQFSDMRTFKSQGSKFISSSLSASANMIINTSQFVDSQLSWAGISGIVSNTVVDNTSIIVPGGTLRFLNTQIYPTKVGSLGHVIVCK